MQSTTNLDSSCVTTVVDNAWIAWAVGNCRREYFPEFGISKSLFLPFHVQFVQHFPRGTQSNFVYCLGYYVRRKRNWNCIDALNRQTTDATDKKTNRSINNGIFSIKPNWSRFFLPQQSHGSSPATECHCVDVVSFLAMSIPLTGIRLSIALTHTHSVRFNASKV